LAMATFYRFVGTDSQGERDKRNPPYLGEWGAEKKARMEYMMFTKEYDSKRIEISHDDGHSVAGSYRI